MTEKNKKKSLKAYIFVWEPKEGFNLDHRFCRGFFLCLKKVLILVINTNLDFRWQTLKNIFRKFNVFVH
jgi:hypothetical protein